MTTITRTRIAKAAVAAGITAAIALAGVSPAANAGETDLDPGGFTPSSIAVDPNTHRAFALNPADGSITVIDTRTNTITGKLPADVTGESYEDTFLLVDPVLGLVYTFGASSTTSRGTTYKASVQNEETGGVASGWSGVSLNLARARPTAAAIDPFTHEVYVSTVETSGPLQIARLTKFVAGDRPSDIRSAGQITRLPNNVTVDSIAVDPLLRQVYLTNTSAGTVSVIDEVTGTYKALDIPVGLQPRGLAVDTYSHDVFVANAGSGTVSVIDGYSRSVTGVPIAVGGSPDEVDIDQIRGRVYVKQDAAGGTGGVTVFDSSTRSPMASPLAVGATREVAIDGLNHTVYASRATGSAIAVVTE